MRQRSGGKIYITGILLLMLGGSGLVGCGSQKEAEKVTEAVSSVMSKPQCAVAECGALRVTASYDATVGPYVEQLTFEEEGMFGTYQVRLGDAVKKGDILAYPDVEHMGEELQAAKETLEDIETDYAYHKTTLENRMQIAKLELENVYNELKAQKKGTEAYSHWCMQAGIFDEQRRRLELELGQLTQTYELERTHQESEVRRLQKLCAGNVIRAPFDGEVVALADVNTGDAINKELYYVAVADLSAKYARCEKIPTAVLEHAKEVLFWKDGEEYALTFVPQPEDYNRVTNNYGEKPYSQFALENEEEYISNGDYGKVRLVVAEKEDVLLLPAIAVRKADGVSFVYKDADGTHQKVLVETGLSDGIWVEIIKGLREGDVVYVQE